MDLMHELEMAWHQSEIVDVIRKGDTFISRYSDEDYTFAVAQVDNRVMSNDIRRYKRAEVEIPKDAFGIIAELSWQPWAGRQVFLRSGWDKNLWVSETEEEVTLDNLKDIRVVKDEGEFL